MADEFIDVSTWQNLQQSTGESFAAMANRLTSPELFAHLDAGARASNERIATAIRKLTDDKAALARFQPAAAGK